MTEVFLPIKNNLFDLVERVAHYLYDGKNVVAHCRMGIGRASMLAAALLLRQGEKPNAVFDMIRKCRGPHVPDTDEQKQWIMRALGLNALSSLG